MKRLRYIFMILSLLLVLPLVGCHSDSVVDLDDQLSGEGSDGGDESGEELYFDVTLPQIDRFSALGAALSQFDGDEMVGSSFVMANAYVSGRSVYDYSVIPTIIYSVTDSSGDSSYNIIAEDTSNVTLLNQSYMFRYVEILDSDGAVSERVAIGVIYDVEGGVLTQISTLDSESGNYGSGGIYDPYIICSENDLNEMIGSRLDNNEDLEYLNFELGAPITLTSDFQALGHHNSSSFKGTLKGGSLGNDTSNAIYNLSSTDTSYAGLFYKLAYGGLIENLTLSNFSLQGTKNVGAIAAYGSGGTLSNVKLMSGNIIGEESVGGFIGSGVVDVITGCKNYANIIATTDSGSSFGGYIGYLYTPNSSVSEGNITISSSSFDGFISASGSKYVGGIIGHSDNNGEKITLKKCYVAGVIEGGEATGGLVGQFSDPGDSVIENCKVGMTMAFTPNTDGSNTAEVVRDVTLYGYGNYVGGLIGNLSSGSASQYLGITDSSIEMGVDSSNKNDAVVQTKGGFSYLGGLVGRVVGVDFKYCTFENNGARIGSSDSDVDYVGGIIGCADNASIDHSTFTNSGVVESGGDYIGGVVGKLEVCNNSSNSTLKNYASYIVGSSNVGGCVGWIVESVCDDEQTITMCNYGSVYGASTDDDSEEYRGSVGGIAGLWDAYGYLASSFMLFNESGYTSGVVSGGDNVGGYFGVMKVADDASTTYDFSNEGNITVYGEENVGGIVGRLESFTKSDYFTTIWVSAKQYMSVRGGPCVGGCIGYLLTTNGSNIYVTTGDNIVGGYNETTDSGTTEVANSVGKVTVQSGAGGGLIGRYADSWNDGGIYLYIYSSYNRIDVQAEGSGVLYLGGIIGDARNRFQINGSCNVGDITSSGGDVGGIVGMIHIEEDKIYGDVNNEVSKYSQIYECYNAGEISDTSESDNRGGIVGRSSSSIRIYDCFNMGDVPSGGYNVAGILGYGEPDSGSDNNGRFDLRNCYNIGQTGWGSVGGGSMNKKELYRVKVYYYEGASGGDYDSSKVDDSISRTASEMKSISFTGIYGTWCWSGGGGTSIPYLNTVAYYENDEHPSID